MNTLNSQTKILFITGGVFSSLGKGMACSGIGALLKNLNFKVMNMKLDPYLNVDAGTMSPYQHGEVFVTKDGKETDLDIGNYERFLNIDLPNECNITSGLIFQTVLKAERDGKYLGKTVQFIPHITNEIKDQIINMANKYNLDFLIVEVGGTVGDIESIPFLEAIRQLYYSYNDQVLFIHLVPIIEMLTSTEEKTKPLQHSTKELMGLGIVPHVLMIRGKKELSQHNKEKISLTCGVPIENIVSLPNIESVYYLPEYLLNQNLHNIIFEKLKMDTIETKHLGKWSEFVKKVQQPKQFQTKIAIIGKYAETSDAYLSVINSLEIAAIHLNSDIKIDLISAEKLNEQNVQGLINYDGILVPGGFGERGIEGKILAIKFARENNISFLGICLGMQLMAIEFARNVLDLKDANSTEFNETTKNPIITLIEGKHKEKEMGGTLRLGNYPCIITENTKTYNAYNKKTILERHRHRYEFNNEYIDIFNQNGLIVSGWNKENELVEILELKSHRFFIACQSHPEFTTKTFEPNPLFFEFIKSAKHPK